MKQLDKPIPLGTKTPFGKIVGIHSKSGERSYFMENKYGVVTLMPADMLEPMIRRTK